MLVLTLVVGGIDVFMVYFYLGIVTYYYFLGISGDCFKGFGGCELILYFFCIFIEFVGFCYDFGYLIYFIFYF